MFTAIRAFILALPELTKLVQNILNGVQEILEIQKENALSQKEILAVQKAASSKDSSDLEQVFRGSEHP